MAQQLQLEVVTPEKLALQATVDGVIVPAYDGFRGIGPDHEAFVARLKLGELTYTQGGRSHFLVVGAGLLEIRDNLVNVLVDKAQRPEEIDVVAVESKRKKASELLQQGGAIDYQKTQAELEACDATLQVARRKA